MSLHLRAVKHGALALIAAGLLGTGTLAGAVANDPAKPPAKPAAKTHPRAHTKSAGRRRAATAPHKAPARRTATHKAAALPGSPGPAADANAPTNNPPPPVNTTPRIPRNTTSARAQLKPTRSPIHNARPVVNFHDNLGGGQTVIVERRDGTRLVAELGRPGFVQRGYKLNGHDFARRSYYDHGVIYESFFRAYRFRELQFSLYVPGSYYPRAFYGWTYNPWPKPAAFAWGWTASPWFAHFGYYFAPYSDYPSASFWLTDYMISQDLQASFVANQEGGEEDGTPPQPGSANPPPVLTPEIKQKIANEVKDQLAMENQEAALNAANHDIDPGSSGIARLISDGRPHVFVAGGNLDGNDTSSGQLCVIGDGDILEMQTPPAADATTADLIVLSSKGKPECEISATVQVQLTDLQEMQNHMRESIDRGLKILADKQGTDGLPAAPPAAQTPSAQPQYAAVAPPPDPQDVAEIQQQEIQLRGASSNQAVGTVSGDVAQPSPAPASDTSAATGSPEVPAAPASPASPTPADTAATPAPPAIQIGQTINQVEAALGAPTRIAHHKSGTIFYYNGKNVTFKDGKVIAIE